MDNIFSLAIHKRKSFQFEQELRCIHLLNPARTDVKAIDKIQNKFRWRIIIKGNMTEAANTIINNCLQNIYDANFKSTRVAVDINPNSMI